MSPGTATNGHGSPDTVRRRLHDTADEPVAASGGVLGAVIGNNVDVKRVPVPQY